MTTSKLLTEIYPWLRSPIIANAPMGGFAGAALASAVSLAGGLGFIGAVNDMSALDRELAQASKTLGRTPQGLLPLGVGFLTFISPIDDAVRLVGEYKPAAAWFFAAHELDEYAVWARRVREASPDTQVWVQIGSVAGAVEVAGRARPDVLVMQGLDAGGHGWEKGAGVVSLVPEALDALAAAGFGGVAVMAAGGIADARGTAAALALGAQGVVMGTRFLSASETVVPHEGYRRAVLETADGGQTTVRAKVFDELKGPNIWPVLFDGRGIVTESYVEYRSGVGIEEIRRSYAEAGSGAGGGFEAGNKRTTVWAGTGIGLVQEEQGAAEIVEQVRAEARRIIDGMKVMF